MAKKKRTARPDVPDLRDRMYEPALIPLPKELVPKIPEEHVLDQESEGACTGFSLAAAINHLGNRSGRPGMRVSQRMLYEMAKRYDEWDGVKYEGSSIRGAIRGWKNNGVCSEKAWPYTPTPGRLSVKRAKEARETTVGAYYRLRPEVSDFHAALNEAGVIVASAQVHSGWDFAKSKIKFRKTTDGGHAFALVGYTEEGFIVQNSWGPTWGQGGLSIWSYEDWAQNLMDAWVVRLALPTPQIFGVVPSAAQVGEEVVERSKPRRSKIAGHFVHIDDGEFKTKGRYWSDDADVAQTARLVADQDYYEHLLIYAHGGLNSPDDSARRIQSLRDGFLRNGIYPYHLMYDTGLAEEFKDLLFRKGKASKERVGGFTDWLDRRTESVVRGVGTRLWEEMKRDAFRAFDKSGAGTKTLRHFLKALRKPGAKKKRIHLVGHSTGGIAIAHMLHALRNENVRSTRARSWHRRVEFSCTSLTTSPP